MLIDSTKEELPKAVSEHLVADSKKRKKRSIDVKTCEDGIVKKRKKKKRKKKKVIFCI